jgi:Cu(I)-responsive transcriptional regulator
MISHTRDFYIGDVAKLTGVKIETIRYYEKAGILTSPKRGQNGYRLYTRAQIERLMFVKRCRALGFSLSQTLSLLDLANSEGRTCRQVSEKAQTRLDEVRAKIKDLKRMEGVLKAYVDACPKNASKDCPIVTALSDMPII